jgi:glycosyltransferase involved in cell wall biosynthesis
MRRRRAPRDDPPLGTIALLPWGDVFEDWLDPLGISLEVFRDEMTGSWMFGFVEALRRAGIKTVLVCVSRRFTAPVRETHRPTGATLWFLPPPRVWSRIAAGRRDGPSSGMGRRSIVSLLRHQLAPYLETPLRPLVRVLRAERCDALLCQEYESHRFDVCVLLGRLTGRPVFGVFQGGDLKPSRLERPIRPLSIRASAGLVVAPRAEAERLRQRYGLADANMAQIFNPIDVARWVPEDRGRARAGLGLPDDTRLAVWHGQLELRRKGLDIILDAWDMLVTDGQGAPARLLLVGAGADAEAIRRRVRRSAVDSVLFVDEWIHDRDRIRRFLSAGDVYVFASRHEGFPMAPIEAMACGLPVVACEVQGVPDIIGAGDEAGGVVVPPGDVRAVANELGRFLADDSHAKMVGESARRRVEERFSLEVVGDQLRTFLLRSRRAVGEPSGSTRERSDGNDGRSSAGYSETK